MNYTFDPTGVALQNTVPGEELTLGIPTSTGYLVVYPTQGPYFFDSLLIKHVTTTGETMLNPGVDFLPGYQYFDATARCNRYICGAIQLTDISRTGKLVLKYNCVGGNFIPNAAQLLSIKASEKRDPQFTTWEQVCQAASIALPVFPTTESVWQGVDSSSIQKAIDELSKLGLVVQLRPEILSTPTDTKFIPTKQEIGLGSVENLPLATQPQAQDGVDNASYMTPLRTAQAISAQLASQLSALGYGLPIPYAAGIALTSKDKTVSFDGDVFAPRQTAVPFTTTGDFYKDREKLILINSTSRGHWRSFTYTITGNEPVSSDPDSVTIDTGIKFIGDVKSIIILNYIGELIRTVDYNLDDGIISLYHPVAPGDMISFLYKRKTTQYADDRPYYKLIKIKDGNRSFHLDDFEFLEADDVRITMNQLTILTRGMDYDIANSTLTLNFPLKLQDTLEVLSNDAVPPLGVLQSRLILYAVN